MIGLSIALYVVHKHYTVEYVHKLKNTPVSHESDKHLPVDNLSIQIIQHFFDQFTKNEKYCVLNF